MIIVSVGRRILWMTLFEKSLSSVFVSMAFSRIQVTTIIDDIDCRR